MYKKIPSEIEKLAPTDASFKGWNSSIAPTMINFFFGNNGTGKSTLGKAIKNNDDVTWKKGKSNSDYTVLVYNQEFIDKNLKNYQNLPGVFTINEKNIIVQQQINDKRSERETTLISLDKALEDQRAKTEEIDRALISFQKVCWDNTAELRLKFKRALEGSQHKKTFATRILAVKNPTSHDEQVLKRKYDTVYSANAKKYESFNILTDVNALDDISDSGILGKPIVSSASTPFAQFVKAIHATAWVREGHDSFNSTPDHKCPYCQQPLPKSFEDDIKDCFDAQYQNLISTFSSYCDSYRKNATSIIETLDTIPAEIYPGIDISPYNDKIDALKGVITSNIQVFSEKKAEPSKIFTIKKTASLLTDLSDMISDFNKMIIENNDILADRQKKKHECESEVWELIAYSLKAEKDVYSKKDVCLTTELSNLDLDVSKLKNTKAALDKEISLLSTKVVNTAETLKSINAYLRDAGFQGFSLREKTGTPNVYEVIRPDGSIAERLSEGEHDFIAFLYFYHLVKGSETAEDTQQDKIVVIDDPVSSMDSNSLFIISAFVREMIEICANNVTGNSDGTKDAYIKQIFILTHNTFFHREVTYSKVKDYQSVNFYLIKKIDNISSIQLCEKPDPDIPTNMINYNPVKNSYAALWEEYKDISTPIPLMNVIRKILEYYFLQLCGYDGASLKKILLKDNRDKFIITDDASHTDSTQYQMISAMLSYINTTASRFDDEIDYIDSGIDVQQCRKTFKMIFQLMGQEQHYNMMMGIDY